jgi:flagellar motor switch protein FliN
MTETIEYEQFDGSAHANGAASGEHVSPSDLSRLNEIPMELSVEIGRAHMTVGETLDLRVGSVVALERLAGETADLLVNGSAIARGEVVVIDEQYGLRITEILDGQNDLSADDALPVAATPAELEPPSAPGIAASSAGATADGGASAGADGSASAGADGEEGGRDGGAAAEDQ